MRRMMRWKWVAAGAVALVVVAFQAALGLDAPPGVFPSAHFAACSPYEQACQVWSVEAVSLAHVKGDSGRWEGPWLVVELVPPPSLVAAVVQKIKYGGGPPAVGATVRVGSEAVRTGFLPMHAGDLYLLTKAPQMLIDLAQTEIVSEDGQWQGKARRVEVLPASPSRVVLRIAFPVPPKGASFDLHVVAVRDKPREQSDEASPWHLGLAPCKPGGKLFKPPGFAGRDFPDMDLRIAAVQELQCADLWEAVRQRSRELLKRYQRVNATMKARLKDVRVTRVVVEGDEKAVAKIVGVGGAALNDNRLAAAVIVASGPRASTGAAPICLEFYFVGPVKEDARLIVHAMVLRKGRSERAQVVEAADFPHLPIPGRQPDGK